MEELARKDPLPDPRTVLAPGPQTSARPIDPNVRQKEALEPGASVWVNASAGTGKTKVLTDRILRLLLPRADGSPGTPCGKILGLTFTKAAASEMVLRINATLARWATDACADTPSEKPLYGELAKLLNRDPRPADMEAARRLFARVIDMPGGLNIMTIHAFCQSVLGRFPLEAGVPLSFTLAEEREAVALLREARDAVLARARREKHSPAGQAFTTIGAALNEEQFTALAGAIADERSQVDGLLEKYFGVEGLYTALCAHLEIPPGKKSETFLGEVCRDEAFDPDTLREASALLCASSSKTDQDRGEILAVFLESKPEQRAGLFESYASAFLTAKDEIRKTLLTRSLAKQAPHLMDHMTREAERLQGLKDRLHAVECALLTRDLFLLVQEILDEFQNIKTKRSVLDFNDLIFKTLHLLRGRIQNAPEFSMSSWVLYKMDQGIDHILVDEAQDTNPEQWLIIEALCAEFFSGEGAHNEERTLFVVGDDKQSIYSFQRASPEEFRRMHHDFSHKVKSAQKEWRMVDLDISFRSTDSVLRAVDSVFSQLSIRGKTDMPPPLHRSFRTGQEGVVKLWPLFEAQKEDNADELSPWARPLRLNERPSSAAVLATHIAQTIRDWLDRGEMLPSRGRKIAPGDILILVRTRNAFVHTLSAALKAQNIPVSGADRMILGEQLIVKDLLACAAFTLLPPDDLTLACLLKSPLIGMEEEALFDLAHDRPGTLWERLQSARLDHITAWLEDMIARGQTSGPFDFFSRLLNQPCPADAISGLRALEARLGRTIDQPLQEFLDLTLTYGRDHTPSLQKFMQFFESQPIEIKREFSGGDPEIRIMTVHGAKGLQAPIVILPDTVCTTLSPPGQSDRRLLWPRQTGQDLPLWSPHAALDFKAYREARAASDQRIRQEYYRLLYVAMTRAEDRLYIGGYTEAKTPMEDCWYNLISQGLTQDPETDNNGQHGLRLYNPQTREPDRESAPAAPNILPSIPPPAWIYKPAPPEISGPGLDLHPARASTEKPAFLSPLPESFPASFSDTTKAFKRGLLIHKLLEILPKFPPEKRRHIGQKFMDIYDQNIEKKEIVVDDLLVIFGHSFAGAAFGPGSQAEVPVAGTLPDGRMITGRIDRLLITPDQVLIIDYKTDRAPPATLREVPCAYKNQIRAYKALLEGIYPDRPVRGALLWTQGPLLMPLTDEEFAPEEPHLDGNGI